MQPRSLTLEQVLDRLRMSIGTAGGVTAWAREHGFTNSFVYAVLNGRRPLTKTICKPLGVLLTRKVTLRFVEDGDGSSDPT